MQAFSAVVRKELLERRMVLAAALIVGFMPLVASWTVSWRGVSSAEVRDYSALMIVALFAAGTALATGSSLVCRELVEGRSSFYFARPVGGWSLWGGKLTAALALLAASILIVWLPSLAAGSRPWRLDFLHPDPIPFPKPFPWDLDLVPYVGDWGLFQKLTVLDAARQSIPLAVAVLLLLLVPLAHAAGVLGRVRSAWLLFDLAMLLTVATLLTAAAGRLAEQGALYGLWNGARIAVFALVAASVLAPGFQLALGRSRPSRSHGAFSLTFWTPLAVTALGLLVHAHLATRAAPEDLDQVLEFKAAPHGEWAVVGGLADAGTGYMPAYALNLADGSSHLLDPLTFFDRAAVFSGDGRRLAWNRCIEAACEVRWRDLAGSGSATSGDRPGVLEYRRPEQGAYYEVGEPIALSPDGRRLALIQGNQLAVYELESNSLAATARLPSRELIRVWMHFVSDDVVRVAYRMWNDEDYRMEIWELDIPSNGWLQTGAVPAWQYEASPEGDRMIVRWKLDEPIKVFDGRGENELYELDYRLSGFPVRFRFLSEGRIAVGDPTRLAVFSPSGEELHRFDFGSKSVVLGGEPAAGRLLVGVRADGGGHETPAAGLAAHLLFYAGDSETRLLDLESGRTLQSFPGLLPSTRAAATGSPATKVLFGDRGAPFRFDAERGTVEPLLRLDG